jgi:glycerol transport system substrate-binding protein
MSLVLEHIGRKSGRDTIIDDVSLMRERGTMNVLLGPTLADQTVKYWYEQTLTDGNLASQRKLANEKPPAETIDYDALTQICAPAPPRPKKV